MNSVQSLKNHFLEQLEATPSRDEIVGYAEEIKHKVDKATAAEAGEEVPPPAEAKPAQPPPPGPPPHGPPHGPGHRQGGEVRTTKRSCDLAVIIDLFSIVGRSSSQTTHSVVCHRNEIVDGSDSISSGFCNISNLYVLS